MASIEGRRQQKVNAVGGRRRHKAVVSVLVTALVLSSVLSFPTSASAISVTQTTPQATYLVGAVVGLPAELNVDSMGSGAIKEVILDIQGPQPLLVSLPLSPGEFTIPTPNSGVVSGKMVIDGGGDSAGYGYGYGGQGYQMRYDPLNWKPPILLNPGPPSPPPILPAWKQAFTVAGSTPLKGLGYDGNGKKLYAVVDGSFVDRVLVLNPESGALISSFNAPGDLVEAAEFMPAGPMPGLYLADTREYFGAPHGRVYHYSAGSSAPHHSFAAPIEIGGLASNGAELLLGARDTNHLFRVNPESGSVIRGPISLTEPQGQPFFGGPVPGSRGLAFYAPQRLLLWSTGDMIAHIDMSDATPVVQKLELLGTEVTVEGLALRGGEVYMAGKEPADTSEQRVLTARLPNSPLPEPTVVGSYNARIRVVGNQVVDGPLVSFALARVDQTRITMTSPTSGSVVSSSSVNVVGSVNDPSITSVGVEVGAAHADSFNDGVESVAAPSGMATIDIWQPSGLWHVSEDRSLRQPGNVATLRQAGAKSWAYNKAMVVDGPPEYNTGSVNTGFLETKGAYQAGAESRLTFWTAWNTEPSPDFDKKVIEANDGTGWQPVAQIVDAGQVADPTTYGNGGLTIWGVDKNAVIVDASSGIAQVPVPQFTWKPVVIEFRDRFKSKSVHLRFAFDTADPFANYLEGWYVDNIAFKSASLLASVKVPVDADLKFATALNVGSASTRIRVTASSGYAEALGNPPELVGVAVATVGFDSVPPVVVIDAMPSVVTLPRQTISGVVVESNLDLLAIRHVTRAGKSLMPAAMTATDASTTAFSQNVLLAEGANTIEVVAVDRAGLSAGRSVTIIYNKR